MNKDLNKQALEEFKKIEGFIKENNYQLLEVKENFCIMEAMITKSSLNPYNIAHGGFIFGLADTAAGIASKTTGRSAVTTTANINYLYPIKGEKIKAEAKCLKSGKTIALYEVEIYDNNTLAAKATFEYYFIK